jgi:hypothetical protein
MGNIEFEGINKHTRIPPRSQIHGSYNGQWHFIQFMNASTNIGKLVYNSITKSIEWEKRNHNTAISWLLDAYEKWLNLKENINTQIEFDTHQFPRTPKGDRIKIYQNVLRDWNKYYWWLKDRFNKHLLFNYVSDLQSIYKDFKRNKIKHFYDLCVWYYNLNTFYPNPNPVPDFTQLNP